MASAADLAMAPADLASSDLSFPTTASVMVGLNGNTFTPQTVDIAAGGMVTGTWASDNHSVTSGVPPPGDNKFCSPTNTVADCSGGTLNFSGDVYSFGFST